jgi:hypothetical protein
VNFASVKSLFEELWGYAYLRDRPFRDLLALLETGVKYAEWTGLNDAQRDVLRQAFSDLARWMLDDETVDGHRDRFADHDLDVTGPLRPRPGQKLRVRVEVIED